MRKIGAVLAAAALLPVMFAAPAFAEPEVPGFLDTTDTTERTYIVVLDEDASPEDVADRNGDDPSSVYEYALTGYAAEMTAADAADLLQDPSVSFVQEDHPVQAFDQDVPNGIARTFAPDNPNLEINGQDDYVPDVGVAVLDSGVDASHPDLNVVDAVDCTSGTCVSVTGSDGNGHGTHVAGSIAAIDNGEGVVGVAPGADIWSVQVLGANGSGSLAGVAAGVDYVTANAGEIAAANLSLGCQGCTDQALSQALTASVSAGVAYAVAAGNSSIDAGNFFPANHPDVLTVSSMADSDGAPGGSGGTVACTGDDDDSLSYFSNYGSVIDIAAPGSCITSTLPGGGYGSMSGTSMASPHVAGGLALLAVGSAKPSDRAGVLALYETLVGAGNHDWTDTSGDGFHEPMLDVSNTDLFPADGDGDTTPPVGPVADVFHSCDDTTLTCSFDGSASASDGDVTDWSWDFGDGSSDTGATVAHAYGSEGDYTVTLTVTDDAGLTDTAEVEVSVGSAPGHTAPTASFSGGCYSFFYLCEFDASASSEGDAPIESYAWDFGDGSTGSGASTWYFYSGPGTYTVTLTVTDETGATGSTTETVNLS